MLSTRREAEVPSTDLAWTRVDTLLLVSVMLLAACFTFHGLDSEALWQDEATTFRRASMPLPQLAADAIGHWHIPTYFALIHFVLLLGDTEWWLRMPSALFGVLAVGACYFYGRLARDRFTGGVAAVLLALSRFQLHYAQEARMYSLLLFSTTLAFVGLIWLVKHPALAALPFLRRGTGGRFEVTPAWRYWLLCVLGLILTLYVHNMASMSAIALALVALGSLLTEPTHRWGLLRNWCLAGALVAAAYLRWVFVVLSQISHSGNQTWGRQAMRDLLGNLTRMFAVPLDTPARVGLPILGAALVLFGLGMSFRKGRGRVALAILGLAVLPIVAALLAGSVRTVFSPRTLIGATSSGEVLVALGISYLFTPLAGVVTLALAGLSLRGLSQDYQEATKDGWRDVLPFIEKQTNEKSVIVCAGRAEFGPYNYYVTRRNRPYKAPPCAMLQPPELEEKAKGTRSVVLLMTTTRAREATPTIQTMQRLQWEQVRQLKARHLQVIQYRRAKRG